MQEAQAQGRVAPRLRAGEPAPAGTPLPRLSSTVKLSFCPRPEAMAVGLPRTGAAPAACSAAAPSLRLTHIAKVLASVQLFQQHCALLLPFPQTALLAPCTPHNQASCHQHSPSLLTHQPSTLAARSIPPCGQLPSTAQSARSESCRGNSFRPVQQHHHA